MPPTKKLTEDQLVNKQTKLERIKRRAREKERAERPQSELIIRKASEVKHEPLVLLYGGRLIKGTFQMVVGPGEAGKGFWSVDTLSHLSTGTPFPGERQGRTPMHCLMCVTEDTQERVVGRLRAASADLDLIHFIDGPPTFTGGLVIPSPVALGSDAGSLVKIAREKKAGALFFETTLEHLGDRDNGQVISTNNEFEVRKALSPALAVCREAGLIGWGIMHPRKSVDGGIEDSISGSAAFRNIVRGVLHVYRDPADSEWRLLCSSKANYLRNRPDTLRFRIEPWENDITEAKVVWGLEGKSLVDQRSAEDLWREMKDKLRETKRRDYSVRDAESFLVTYLAEGIKPPEEVIEAAKEDGITESSLRRAKRKLSVESVKQGMPAKVIGWRLPKEDM